MCDHAAPIELLLEEHRQHSTEQRAKYYHHNSKAITGGKKLEMYKFMSIILDGMDQAKTQCPSWERPPKWIEGNTKIELHLMGVITAAHPRV